MNYKNIYDRLIEYRSINTPSDEYCEAHHIVPRCIGGEDEPSNIIILTAREHYFAHLLLTKIYPDKIGLLTCLKLLSIRNPHHRSRTYSFWRQKIVKNMTQHGRDLYAQRDGFDSYEQECSVLWEELKKCATKKDVTLLEEKYNLTHHRFMSCMKTHASIIGDMKTYNDFKSRLRSEHSKKIRRNITEEQEAFRIERIRESIRLYRRPTKMFGKDNPMFGVNIWKDKGEVECPHCGKKMNDSPAARRWHFNNCKHKMEE